MMPDMLRIGVAGCGRVFERFHLPALKDSPLWQLSAVCDLDPDRQQWAARAAPVSAVFGSLDQMLDKVELDALLIAAPPEQQAALAAKAVDRGLHLLIEKPGGRNLADAEQIARVAAGSDRVLWVAFNRRFNPNYAVMRDMLATNSPPANADFRFELSFSVTEWRSVSGYLGDSELGGDVLRDLASHQLDLLAWIFSSPVTAVRCRAWQRRNPGMERLEYEVRLANGAAIPCLAEHGERYRESLAIKLDGGSMLSYPTGLVKAGFGSGQALQRWAKLRYWIDRKLIRVGMLPDPLWISFRNQLQAFAAAIQGRKPSVAGSSVESVLMTHRAMQLILDGRESMGEWRTLTVIPGIGRMALGARLDVEK